MDPSLTPRQGLDGLESYERLRELASPEGAQRAAEALSAALPEGELAHLAVLGAVVLTGGLLCFRGHRIFRFLVFVLGFALVGSAAVGLAHAEMGWEGGGLLAAGVGAGIVGGLLFLLGFYLAVFGVGAACGAGLCALGGTALGMDPGPLALALPALAGGALALFVQRPVICLLTAFQGASVLALVAADRLAEGDGLVRLVGEPHTVVDEASSRPWLLAAWGGLAVVGAVAQIASRSKASEEDAEAA